MRSGRRGSRSLRVPARAALAHLEPRPLSPILEAAQEDELSLLRCPGLDEQILVPVLGRPCPIDTLRTPAGRVAALAPFLLTDCVLLGANALWVHAGGPPPRSLVVCVDEKDRSRWKGHRIHRAHLPRMDIVAVGGQRCATLARAAVDVARTAPACEAVAAILTARGAGVSRVALFLALSHCRGGAAAGRPRAAGIIESLMPSQRGSAVDAPR
ncbi:hypothetical protein J5X07_07990 [Actinomyces bowdenii]|uniref:Uncharacterized protein n=1 Tax=Actinomyces bowdenii TaxID=131109 RepID=A0A3P1V445_9ACTO|nr:hypothetical protein [Actinomyces bowdenii]MBO3724965.1 hypothetical protein [Actinomyces bowdenii]RRD28962.1 hypothetical protein EII10_08375 [Actinomyces bowdenii]